jgi:hypothetical protein
MSRTAEDTPNAWRTGWWDVDEDELIAAAMKRLARKLNRAPSSLATRVKHLERGGRLRIWESEWKKGN